MRASRRSSCSCSPGYLHTRRGFGTAASGGGYVLGSDYSVHDGILRANGRALTDARNRWGTISLGAGLRPIYTTLAVTQ